MLRIRPVSSLAARKIYKRVCSKTALFFVVILKYITTVDSQIPNELDHLRKSVLELRPNPLMFKHRFAVSVAMTLIIKLGVVVVFTPIFLIPAVIIAILGGYLGNVYIRLQLSIKREMSNAKAPVLAVFGDTVAGLSELPLRLF